jgi:glutamate-1-semialdehyde 2,1-aminomutase
MNRVGASAIPNASDVIPGGAHTYSKGDDQFPSNAPRYLEQGEGVQVWDEDGRSYLDWGMGLRTMSLGYGVKPVIEAAIAQMWAGSNFTRPSRIESETAQDLIDLIPSAEMVKFGKNGSTVTSAAVKLARAFTGRPLIAVCADQPFFSYDDWFIGTTPCDGGIPDEYKTLTRPFTYNDWESVERLFVESGPQIAGLIMEAATTEPPQGDFLHRVRERCRANGSVFILDEMITGFRWHLQGAQTYFDLDPDLSTFGKGIANGFSVSALVGRRDIMELGGLRHDRKRVFLISTTHGAENHALAACRAAMKIFREEPVVEHMWSTGRALIDGLNSTAADLGMGEYFRASGYPCSPDITFRDRDGRVSMPFRTLFLQEMVRAGVIINYVAPSYSHRAEDVERTIGAAREALVVYREALESGIDKFLVGPAVKPVFRPYN